MQKPVRLSAANQPVRVAAAGHIPPANQPEIARPN